MRNDELTPTDDAEGMHPEAIIPVIEQWLTNHENKLLGDRRRLIYVGRNAGGERVYTPRRDS